MVEISSSKTVKVTMTLSSGIVLPLWSIAISTANQQDTLLLMGGNPLQNQLDLYSSSEFITSSSSE
jgi:hypothetical protein